MIVIRAVRLIDGRSPEAQDGVDVQVDADRITSIRATVDGPDPVGATVIDGTGSTLLPGLIDCHAHYPIDSTVEDGFAGFRHDSPLTVGYRAAGMARRALMAGVTTTRSAGSPDRFDYELRDAIDAGHVLGPRMLAAESDLEVLAQRGTTLVPTLSVTDVWRTIEGLSEVSRARQDYIEPLHRRSCETAIRLGIPLATGTDCGVRGVTPEMVAREVRLIAEHGASAMAAIQAATLNAARLLGLEDQIGTVEPGKRADLLMVEGDPLSDLRCLERVRVVV